MERAPVYKTQGVILKKTDLSQTDRLLTIYTEKFGKILARAKGIDKRESKLKSLIEPFNVYEFMLAKGKASDVLANSWPQKEFVNLRANLEALALSMYFVELIDKLIPAPERDPKIWALLVRGMEALNEPRKDFSKLKTAFEEKLLEFLGHPTFSAQRRITSLQKLDYLESLAGEYICSYKFLNICNL